MPERNGGVHVHALLSVGHGEWDCNQPNPSQVNMCILSVRGVWVSVSWADEEDLGSKIQQKCGAQPTRRLAARRTPSYMPTCL